MGAADTVRVKVVFIFNDSRSMAGLPGGRMRSHTPSTDTTLRSAAVLGGLAASALLWPVACDRGAQTGPDSPAALVQASALAQVGTGVVVPALEEMQADIDALTVALEALEEAPTSLDARAAAQVAFEDAFVTWQQLEVMQIGPMGSSLSAISGEDVRDEVYSWPTVNPCRIDQETVEAGWVDEAWFTDNLVNTYGLDAMEYLLWAPDDNDCPAQVAINADGTWDDLGPEAIGSARAAYALTLGERVAGQVDALLQTWHTDEGNFAGRLARTSSDTPYATDTEALNAVFDAMFYLEKTTKDRKLATPLGLGDCEVEDCATAVESPWATLGVPAIHANLVGFRALFTGAEGAGMDDLLAEIGEQDLADELLVHLDGAIALAESMEGSLEDLVRDDTARVEALYGAVQEACALLKGDIAVVLTLQVPAEAAGDND